MHTNTDRKLRLPLIKPSLCDDDGWVRQCVRADAPSSFMAVLNSPALDCQARQVLGNDADTDVRTIDEIRCRLKPKCIIERIRAADGKGLVALAAVQSNDYSRTLGITRQFRVTE